MTPGLALFYLCGAGDKFHQEGFSAVSKCLVSLKLPSLIELFFFWCSKRPFVKRFSEKLDFNSLL